LVLDASNNIYVTGETSSSDFPVSSGCYDNALYTASDVFVSKLNVSLTTLSASTYLGWSGSDYAKNIALDKSNNILISGVAGDSYFPTTVGAYDVTHQNAEAFIALFNNALTSLTASTYFGAEGNDYINDMFISTSGKIFITGTTSSTAMPVQLNSYDQSLNGGGDVFVASLNSNLSQLYRSTYIGSTSTDEAYAIAMDEYYNLVVAGETQSTNYPISAGVYDATYNALRDIFITKIDTNFTCVPPMVTTEPINKSICSGSYVTFSLVSTGATNYQWMEYNGTAWSTLTDISVVYSGSTTQSLTMYKGNTLHNGYKYRCIITNNPSGCKDTSATVTLTINNYSTVTADPSNKSICSGGTTIMRIAATNATGYQWMVYNGSSWSNVADNSYYSGATNDTLTINNALASMNGYRYRGIAIAGCPDTSAYSTLTVNSLPQITKDPIDTRNCEGLSVYFKSKAINALSYKWIYSYNYDLAGGYENVYTDSLVIPNIQRSMDNEKYKLVAYGNGGCNDTSNYATLIADRLPTNASVPNYSSLCENLSVKIGGSATDAMSYKWIANDGNGWVNISNGSIYHGVTSDTLFIDTAKYSMDGYLYQIVAYGENGCNDSSNSHYFDVLSRAYIDLAPTDLTVCEGTNATFTSSGVNFTGYQWQAKIGSDWLNMNSGGFYYSGETTNSLTLNNVAESESGDLYRLVLKGECNDTSDEATLLVNPKIAIESQPSNIVVCNGDKGTISLSSSNASQLRWYKFNGVSWDSLTNTVTYGGTNTSSLVISNVNSGFNANAYRCVLKTAKGCSENSYTAELYTRTRASVSVEPKDTSVCLDSPLHFIVKGSDAVGYKWQTNQGSASNWIDISNGSTYDGVFKDTLNILTFPFFYNNYGYRCVVEGDWACNDTSGIAVLHSNRPPAITVQPEDAFVSPGINTNVFVTANYTMSYQWQVNQGSTWTNILAAGTNPLYVGWSNDTLEINSSILSNSGYLYRCICKNVYCAADTTNSITLSVDPVSGLITKESDNLNLITGGDNQILFNLANEGEYRIKLYDLSGKLLYEKTMEGKQFILPYPYYGMLVVECADKSAILIQKVFIK